MSDNLFAEAADLADRYNWPDEAHQLRAGIVPDGFSREVSRAIILFKSPVPFGSWIPPNGWRTQEEYDMERGNDKTYATELVWLRTLIAKIRISQRGQPSNT